MLDKLPSVCYNIIKGKGKNPFQNKRPIYGRKRKNYGERNDNEAEAGHYSKRGF